MRASFLGAGGGGAPSEAPGITIQAEDTFSLVLPAAKLAQGGAGTVTIGIRRGQNFGQDVSLKLDDLPKGISLVTASPRIMQGVSGIVIALQAADAAARGDFTVIVTGQPATGPAVIGEMSIAVTPYDPDGPPSPDDSAALEQWKRDTSALISHRAVLRGEK